MKRLFLLMIFALLLTASPGLAYQSAETVDAEWQAKIWDYACEKRDSSSVVAVLRAIEMKHQTEYIPALEKFFTIRRTTSGYRADAVRVLASLGAPGIEDHLNQILVDEVLTYATIFGTQIREKSKALRLMKELGFKVSPEAKEVLLKDIRSMIEMKYPNYALWIAKPLNQLGVDLPVDLKNDLGESVSIYPRNVDVDDLVDSGIVPNWEKMLADHQKYAPDLWQLILAVGDEKSLKFFIDNYEKYERKGYGYGRGAQIAKIIVGDINVKKEIMAKLNVDYVMRMEPVAMRLPDDILLASLNTKYSSFLGDDHILNELKKRGHTSEVEAFLKENRNIVQGAKDFESLLGDQYGGALWCLSFHDTDFYLDFMYGLLNKEQKYQHNIAAQMLQTAFGFGRYQFAPDTREWIKKNPEKFADAISTVLTTQYKPHSVLDAGNTEEYIEMQASHNRHLAFEAMNYLPGDVFTRNFGNLKNDELKMSAYIAGNYFKTDWAYKKPQQAFYDTHDRR